MHGKTPKRTAGTSTCCSDDDDDNNNNILWQELGGVRLVPKNGRRLASNMDGKTEGGLINRWR